MHQFVVFNMRKTTECLTRQPSSNLLLPIYLIQIKHQNNKMSRTIHCEKSFFLKKIIKDNFRLN